MDRVWIGGRRSRIMGHAGVRISIREFALWWIRSCGMLGMELMLLGFSKVQRGLQWVAHSHPRT